MGDLHTTSSLDWRGMRGSVRTMRFCWRRRSPSPTAPDLPALEDPENDIAGNPGSAHRTLIRREAGVNDPKNERDI